MDASALTRPVGPLPLWGWSALAVGGAVLFLAVRGHPAAAALVNPGIPTPAAPTDPTAAAPPPQPVSVLSPGQTVYDPNTGMSTPPVSVSDLLGGQSLGDFIGKLGPDYSSFSLTDGGLGTSVTHSAQNLVDAQTHIADLQAQTQNYGIWSQYSQYLVDAGLSERAQELAAQTSAAGTHWTWARPGGAQFTAGAN